MAGLSSAELERTALERIVAYMEGRDCVRRIAEALNGEIDSDLKLVASGTGMRLSGPRSLEGHDPGRSS